MVIAFPQELCAHSSCCRHQDPNTEATRRFPVCVCWLVNHTSHPSHPQLFPHSRSKPGPTQTRQSSLSLPPSLDTINPTFQWDPLKFRTCRTGPLSQKSKQMEPRLLEESRIQSKGRTMSEWTYTFRSVSRTRGSAKGAVISH